MPKEKQPKPTPDPMEPRYEEIEGLEPSPTEEQEFYLGLEPGQEADATIAQAIAMGIPIAEAQIIPVKPHELIIYDDKQTRMVPVLHPDGSISFEAHDSKIHGEEADLTDIDTPANLQRLLSRKGSATPFEPSRDKIVKARKQRLSTRHTHPTRRKSK